MFFFPFSVSMKQQNKLPNYHFPTIYKRFLFFECRSFTLYNSKRAVDEKTDTNNTINNLSKVMELIAIQVQVAEFQKQQ